MAYMQALQALQALPILCIYGHIMGTWAFDLYEPFELYLL